MQRLLLITGALTSLAVAGRPDDTQSVLPPEVQLGSRVRLRTSDVPAGVEGLVVALDDRVLTIAADKGVPVKVPVTSLTSLQVGSGKKRNALKGFIIGAAVGLLGYALDDQREESGGLWLGSPLLGAGIGALVKTDRWHDVPVRSSTGRMGTSTHPAAVTVTLRF
jgi:hypothetical protein